MLWSRALHPWFGGSFRRFSWSLNRVGSLWLEQNKPPPPQLRHYSVVTCGRCWMTVDASSNKQNNPRRVYPLVLQRAFSSSVPSRTNESVRKFKQVLLVNENGEKIGVMSGEQAYQHAVTAQQDVMEVAAKATPPVWKLVNLKQVFRDSRLREKKERKQALEQRRKSEVKEIRISPAIDDHDFQVKVDKAKEFLSSGRRVRFSVRFRRGQGKYAVRLESLVERIKVQLKDIPCTTVVKRKPRLPPKQGISAQDENEQEEEDPFELYIEPSSK